jgi:glutamate N-acetyltransferase/amino-acid N-acetyltransferase
VPLLPRPETPPPLIFSERRPLKKENHLPSGFRAAGFHSGIGKKPLKPDLALFFSEVPAAAAGVFTTNRVKAAPILVSMSHIKKGRAQAIIANSGCANACTGARGLNDAERMAARAAEDLGIPKDSVLVASTGVIGQFLPMDKVEAGIDAVVLRALSDGADPRDAVHAIMTTDTVPKTAGGTLKIGSKTATVWGCVKGAGMIHPNMATMFAFLLTDARIAPSKMRRLVKRASDASFNRLSVDGEI